MRKFVQEEWADWPRDRADSDRERVRALKDAALGSFAVFKRARTVMEMKQSEVAEVLRTSQATVSKMERRPRVDIDVLQALAAAKGFTLQLTLTGPDGTSTDLLAA